MSQALSPRGAAYLARVRELAPLIAQSHAEMEQIRDLPEPLFQALIERDLFRLLQPKSLGGAELDPLDHVQILEAVAQHDASTAWCLGQNNVCGMTAAYVAPDVAREIFNGPRGILAWGPGPAQARAVPGGYRLTGRFNFASGSRHATWLGAHVPVIEPDGKRRLWPDGSAPATYTLLFPRSSVRIEDTWHVIGLRGTGSDGYHAEDLFVPESHAFPRGGPIRPRERGRLYVFTPSPLYASGFCCVALGIARATLDAFIRDVKDTVPRGAKKTRGDNSVVQATIGLAEARIQSARHYMLGTLERIWREIPEQETLKREQYVQIRLASTWGIQQARETVSQLYMAAGAMSIFEQNPFEKRFRDIHTLCQQIQGHAAHFETVGQILLGQPGDRALFSF
jgi:alkylation response protein AidB-like acyl-CoA dehydrogenase